MGLTSKGKVVLVENSGPATGDWKYVSGGKYQYSAQATWGGGSAKLQGKLPNGSAIDLSTASADSVAVLDLPTGEYRVVVATSTAVYASLHHIPQ